MTRYRWNISGFREIRRLPKVERELQREVDRVLAITGHGDHDGYDGGVSRGRTRSRGYVVAYTPHAIKENAEEHTLVTALSTGRGGR